MNQSEIQNLITRLYQNNYEGISIFTYFSVRDQQITEDIIAQTFYKVYKQLDKFDGYKFKPWLYSIVQSEINLKVTDSFKSTINELEISDNLFTINSASTLPAITKDSFKEFLGRVDSLNDLEKNILILRFIVRLDDENISELLHKSLDELRKVHLEFFKKLRIVSDTDPKILLLSKVLTPEFIKNNKSDLEKQIMENIKNTDFEKRIVIQGTSSIRTNSVDSYNPKPKIENKELEKKDIEPVEIYPYFPDGTKKDPKPRIKQELKKPIVDNNTSNKPIEYFPDGTKKDPKIREEIVPTQNNIISFAKNDKVTAINTKDLVPVTVPIYVPVPQKNNEEIHKYKNNLPSIDSSKSKLSADLQKFQSIKEKVFLIISGILILGAVIILATYTSSVSNPVVNKPSSANELQASIQPTVVSVTNTPTITLITPTTTVMPSQSIIPSIIPSSTPKPTSVSLTPTIRPTNNLNVSTWNQYSHTTESYSIKLPSDWKTYETTSAGMKFLFIGGPQTLEIDKQNIANGDSFDGTLKIYTSKTFNELMYIPSGFISTDTKSLPSTFTNREYLRTFQKKDPIKGLITSKLLVINYGGTYYTFTFDLTGNTNIDVIKKIIETFRLKSRL